MVWLSCFLLIALTLKIKTVSGSNYGKIPGNPCPFCSYSCVLLCRAVCPREAQLATAPVLLTKTNSTRAIAVESTGLTAEPFPTTAPIAFSADNRTRVILFAGNLTLFPGETPANVTATAEDGSSAALPIRVGTTTI